MQLLSPQQAAQRLAISRRSLFTLARSPGFPKPLRLGARTVRYSDEELDGWLRQQLDGRKG